MQPTDSPASSRYHARMQAVISYLHDHLDDALTLERLAEVACLSPGHFHRLYRALFGETLAETIRRQRFHRATRELLASGWPLSRIARRSGYGTTAAFNRAFKREFGLTPGAYRTRRSVPIIPPPRLTMEIADMPDVTIRMEPERTLLGLRHQGDYMDIGRSFERICAWAGSRGLLDPGVSCLGLYWDDPDATPVDQLRSAACIEGPAEAAADGIDVFRIPAGRYACLVHTGPYAELPASYRLLYAGWLARSDEEPADGPCIEDYLNDPRVTPPMEWQTRIMVPLRTPD